jgi:hypothetical protein
MRSERRWMEQTMRRDDVDGTDTGKKNTETERWPLTLAVLCW